MRDKNFKIIYRMRTQHSSTKILVAIPMSELYMYVSTYLKKILNTEF